jgi:hypothetical protein
MAVHRCIIRCIIASLDIAARVRVAPSFSTNVRHRM